MARKKGHRADSVAEGLRPAEENDVLELDECWTCVRKRSMSESDVRKQSNKRWLWVALCRRTRPLPKDPAGRSVRDRRAFVIGDRSAKTCARLWSRIPEGYRQGRSFSDFWKSYRPVFEQNPQSDSLDHQQVGPPTGRKVQR